MCVREVHSSALCARNLIPVSTGTLPVSPAAKISRLCLLATAHTGMSLQDLASDVSGLPVIKPLIFLLLTPGSFFDLEAGQAQDCVPMGTAQQCRLLHLALLSGCPSPFLLLLGALPACLWPPPVFSLDVPQPAV